MRDHCSMPARRVRSMRSRVSRHLDSVLVPPVRALAVHAVRHATRGIQLVRPHGAAPPHRRSRCIPSQARRVHVRPTPRPAATSLPQRVATSRIRSVQTRRGAVKGSLGRQRTRRDTALCTSTRRDVPRSTRQPRIRWSHSRRPDSNRRPLHYEGNPHESPGPKRAFPGAIGDLE